MGPMTSRPLLRWLVPLAVVLAFAAAGLAAGPATAEEKLPLRTAEQLLVDLQQADVDGFSGTVEQTADLGIPALPGVSEHGSDFSSLVSGTHRLRVWYAAPDSSKVALLGDLSESAIIRNGDDLWTWSSSENTATHATVNDTHRPMTARPDDAPKTPQEAAERFLSAVDETTEVSVATDVTVAGRPAYELVLQPSDSRSLIRSVRIAVDGAEHVALRVQVFAGERADPVASTAFTEVDFAVPADTTFAFDPPEGATVTEVRPEDHSLSEAEREAARQRAEAAEPTIVGEGWAAVAVSTLPDGELPGPPGGENDGRDGGPDLQAYLTTLPQVSGDWGSGRLLAGTAFSVVVTDDGRVAAGAVAPDLLYDALG